MISEEKFVGFVKTIRNAYNAPDFLSGKSAFLTWYRAFRECNEWSFDRAVEKCVSECKRLPVVADVMTPYAEIERRRLEHRQNFLAEWDGILSKFPNGGEYRHDDECCSKLKRMTLGKTGGDYDRATALAQKINRAAGDFAEKNDPYGNDLDFKEYFMGLAE